MSPMRYDLVSFVTDYGYAGGFVGALHAVVDSITGDEPGVRILDLDHLVPPQDVLLGAVRMERMMRYVRPGVHVGVVDPGVGSDRRGIAVEAGGRAFVGPDNGLLSFAVDAVGGPTAVVGLEREEWFVPNRTATFDGRDVFAPVAAHLARGVAIEEFGEPIDPASLVRIERPAPRPSGTGFEVMVVQVDGFGNVQFGADGALADRLGQRASLKRLDGGGGGAGGGGGEVVATVGATFSDVPIGAPLILSDSDGCLALSVNQGRADDLLGVKPGDAVACAVARAIATS